MYRNEKNSMFKESLMQLYRSQIC